MIARRSPVPVIIVVDMHTSIWRELNGIRLRGDRSQIPIRQLLLNMMTHVQMVMELCSSKKKKRWWNKELDSLKEAAKPAPLSLTLDDVVPCGFWLLALPNLVLSPPVWSPSLGTGCYPVPWGCMVSLAAWGGACSGSPFPP